MWATGVLVKIHRQSIVQIQIKIARENKKGCFPYVNVSSNDTITMTSSSNRLQMAGNMPQLAPGLYIFWLPIPARRKRNPFASICINLWKYPGPLDSDALPHNSLSPGILSNLIGQPCYSLSSSTSWGREGYMIDRPFPEAKYAEQTEEK